MREVFIIGVGQTEVTRNGALSLRELGSQALQSAVASAKLPAEDIGALYVGNMLSGTLSNQQQLGSLVASRAGLGGVEAATVEAGCASGGVAARMGFLAVAAGAHDVVAVCGVECMSHVDREHVTRALATAADWEAEGFFGESFLSLNAKIMKAYMEVHGVGAEAFAPLAVNAHRNALTNPNALLQKSIDCDDYLASRIVVDPIRLFDASPICDGAAAIILASSEIAKSVGRDVNAPRVRVAASSVATAPLGLVGRGDVLKLTAAERSTAQAFTQARITHADVDMFELHDAYTVIAALSLESAGFADPGHGVYFVEDERIGLAGQLPISTMGGLKARGHPVGATGVYQLAETHAQLSEMGGENQVPDVETALVQNIGGTASTVATHVLRRER